jgi:hypothetical protein
VSEEANTWPEGRMASDSIETALAGVREGLPRGYRMRADRHYVDQLASPSAANPVRMVPLAQIDGREPAPASELRPLIESIRLQGIVHPLLVRRQQSRYAIVAGRKRLAAAQVLKLESVPCLVHEVSDAEADALAAADNVRAAVPAPEEQAPASSAAVQRVMSEHFATIAACAELLSPRLAALDRSALDLIKANAWRASRFLDALDLLSGAAFASRERPLAVIFEELADGFAPELRLTGVALRVDSSEAPAARRVNAAEMMAGLSGAVLAMLPLIETSDRAALAIKATASESGALVVELSIERMRGGAAIAARFFDLDAPERPGGHAAAIGATAAKALVDRYPGRATFTTSDGVSRLSLTLAL